MLITRLYRAVDVLADRVEWRVMCCVSMRLGEWPKVSANNVRTVCAAVQVACDETSTYRRDGSTHGCTLSAPVR